MGERDQFRRTDVEILDDELAFDGFWQLRVKTLRHRCFAGGWSEPMRREVHCRGNAVGVLLYDPVLDAVGLVEQFRVGALEDAQTPWLFELVAGLIEPGETPPDVAIREVQEEAGCRVDTLEAIAEYYSSPGGSDEYFYLYCARADLSDVDELHGVEHEHEDIRLHVLDRETLERRRGEGRCNNAHTLLALHWLEQHRPRLREEWVD
jgi:ADP-ribose pyrophosphatase